jgi:hypothetical protein
MYPVLHDEEDRAMCVVCYALCAVCIAICLAVMVYVFLR